MRSKNSAPLTLKEREHLSRVKSAPCSVCDGIGGFAHHINQGDHFTTVALCYDCHQGSCGWHGDKTRWRIYRVPDEVRALNKTLKAIYDNA